MNGSDKDYEIAYNSHSVIGVSANALLPFVASGLALLTRLSRTDHVFTGHRPFPVNSATLEQWSALNKPISVAEYLNRAGPRMYALERSEPPPRVMPHVLTEWRLKPLSTPSETLPLDG
jgi:hypothetical protein